MIYRFFGVLAATAAFGAALSSIDLGVRCISRSPLYWRYNVQYDGQGLPYLAPTHGGQDPNLDQHWPNPGETVTFTAHVRNHGDQAVSGFEYRWLIDGQAQGSLQTYSGVVSPGQTVTVSLQWTWPTNLDDHTVTIVVDPNLLIADVYRQNNTYTDHANALSYSIWVEQGLYERFALKVNGFGTKGFDDWIRWQFDALRDMFARSVYPGVAPNGVLERVRIEEINVMPFDPNNLNNWQSIMAADPHIYLNDGRWQFVSAAGTLAQKQTEWQQYVDTFATTIDWGLIHELMHQLGVIDEYRLNLDRTSNLVTWADGSLVNTQHYFHRGGLMGGGYVLPGYDGTYLDSRSAGFLNRNLHYRRGFYGEYLWDIPDMNYGVVYDVNGAPMAGVQVSAYQKSSTNERISNTPVFTVTTDSSGRFLMPNRSTTSRTTATGHTLKNNPFARVHVVGINSTMLLKFSKNGQEDVRWFETYQPNIAYWSGNTASAEYPFYTRLIPTFGRARIGTVNVALNKPATASSNSSQAYYGNDGDKADPARSWAPSPPSAGQWWKVDLEQPRWIARVKVFPWATNWHDWYSAFHLEASMTGAFVGEQKVIPLEEYWDETRGMADYEVQRLSGMVDQVWYTFAPVRGRYFRIVSDVYQNWVRLQEAEFYEMTAYPEGDLNGDGIVDMLDLNAVLLAFGASGAGHPADANGDGVVDLNDLQIVLLQFSMGT
ncbi:MAG: discoidin domain-containing protein [Fimbriimonadia bacterium]|jgi:hypothetical protein